MTHINEPMDLSAFGVIPPRVRLLAAGENYGRFAIEPLESGHGAPLGNALRRVIVSSIPGAAITRIRVSGMIHEFATIPGVIEDGTQLVLNVKGIRLRSYSERPVTLQLFHHGAGPVRAGDIDAPSTVEIVNPEHYICTIDDDTATLEMQLTVERGRGVTLAENIGTLNIGEIAVDALFSPIPRVNFIIEDVHTDSGEMHDRLVIEIWSDGTVKPGDALAHAAQIIAQHFNRIAMLGQPQATQEEPDERRAISSEIDNRTIDDLGLSTRTYNSLRRAGITSVGQLLALGERDLQAIRNLGPRSVDEIRERLGTLGLIAESSDDGLGESSTDAPEPTEPTEPSLT
jgi:DNA-directed RNA polymerase subunit alpha